MIHPFSAHTLYTIPTSIFSTMSRLAVEYNAVNLGQGFPDFDGPDWIKEEVYRAMKDGKNQYAPMNGILSLRRTIASYQHEQHNIEWNPETEITVTAGATEALFSAILAFINPGDEVIMFEPFYDSHQANVLLAGGVPHYVTLHKPEFSFDISDLETLVTKRTKLLLLNNPNNPTGKVFTREELETLAEFAIRYNLLVLSDEVYEFLTFDGAHHIPIASLTDMHERTITISSTGKTFGMTGWKIGYAIAAAPLTEAIQKVHQFVTFAVNTPCQHAMAAALGSLPSYLPEFRQAYARKRSIMFNGLKSTPFAPHIPSGSYFMMADIPEACGEDDIACATRLVKESGVAVIPPSVFYSVSNEGQTMLRFCFAKKEETLGEGLRRLSRSFLAV